MKKLFVIILIVIVTLIVGLIICRHYILKNVSKDNQRLEQIIIKDINNDIEEYRKNIKSDIVNNKETAIRIAKAVLDKKEIKEHEPYKAVYDNNNKVWVVYGSLRSPFIPKLFGIIGRRVQGGTPYVIIQKRDGKILAIFHEE